jgi:hypothetical protein
MNRKFSLVEPLILSTTIGIIATLAVPWVELRGTYAAWRIVEWHTFWRGQDAFQLASVVASNYRVPIEYATADMQSTMRNLFAFGGASGVWHISALIVLLAIGLRWRLQNGASIKRAMLEVVVLVIVNLIMMYLLSILLALPSSLTSKVDFRTTEEIHTNLLIWSSVNILPVAPMLSVAANLVQLGVLVNWLRTHQPTNKPSN